jgi:hypothetical protein
MAAMAGPAQVVSFGALAIGAGVLLVMSIAASREAYGSISPVDGYWLGPLPWAPLGVGLVLFGATVGVVALTAAMWLGPRWGGRVLSVPVVLSVAFWWATAATLGSGGACCSLPPAFDPIAVAYSAPLWTLSLVVLPAILLATANWLGRPAPRAVTASDYRTVSGA